jgi:hypothetical protein
LIASTDRRRALCRTSTTGRERGGQLLLPRVNIRPVVPVPFPQPDGGDLDLLICDWYNMEANRLRERYLLDRGRATCRPRTASSSKAETSGTCACPTWGRARRGGAPGQWRLMSRRRHAAQALANRGGSLHRGHRRAVQGLCADHVRQ